MGRHIGTTQNNNFLLVKIENAKIKMLELHKLSIWFFVMFMKNPLNFLPKMSAPWNPWRNIFAHMMRSHILGLCENHIIFFNRVNR